jgi:hypothetical protein
MNQKERFLNTMHFKPVDHVPLWFPWLMEETVDKWVRENSVSREELFAGFGCDRLDDMDVPCGFSPYFEKTMLKEDINSITYINFDGTVLREPRGYADSFMPQFVSYPVACREDFKKVEPRLQLNEETRFPADWKEKCEGWKNRTSPLRLWGDAVSRRESGFFGPLRSMMGVENLLYAFYDDPAFVEEMMDNRMELTLSILKKVLADTTLDAFFFWEDMAYKNGPLLSPEMFDRFMVPRYRKITDFLRSHGVDIIIVDCDGDISKLIPLWLKAGVNGMLPFEVQAGMDVVKLRREYGSDLLMIGGIDKMVISKGEKAIDNEIARIAPILHEGGYIPFPDHLVTPAATYDDFRYFMEQLRKANE